MTDAPDAAHFYRRTEEGFVVVKVKPSTTSGMVEKCSEYVIKGQVCSCPGFGYRGSCTHLKSVYNDHVPTPIPLSEARSVVRSLMSEFGEAFGKADLTDDTYERDSDGNVTRVSLRIHPRTPSEIMPSGVWEGCLKENDLRVRLIIV